MLAVTTNRIGDVTLSVLSAFIYPSKHLSKITGAGISGLMSRGISPVPVLILPQDQYK